MHKESFIINCNPLLHVSTLLGHLQGGLSVVVTLRLHFMVELLTVYCVALGGANSLWSRLASRDHREFTPPKTTQYTVSLKMTQQGRNM
jgi:exonuclease I